jgi:hypothetical protein
MYNIYENPWRLNLVHFPEIRSLHIFSFFEQIIAVYSYVRPLTKCFNSNSPGKPGLFIFRKHGCKEHNVNIRLLMNFLQFFNILFHMVNSFHSEGIISEAAMCVLILNRETRQDRTMKDKTKDNMVSGTYRMHHGN